MLGILKITAGMATDGSAEFAMLVCDTSENVYEVAINEHIYIQLMDVIDASLEDPSAEEVQEATPEQPVVSPMEVPKSKTPSAVPSVEALKSKLAGRLNPPQHLLEEQSPPEAPPVKEEDPRRRLASVGFDLDYSASYDDEEEPDPGENSEDMLDEEFAEPL